MSVMEFLGYVSWGGKTHLNVGGTLLQAVGVLSPPPKKKRKQAKH